MTGAAAEYVDVLAPAVRPACGFDDPSTLLKWMQASKSIGPERFAKALEMTLRMFATTAGREGEPDCGRMNSAQRRPSQTQVQSRPAVAWREYRHGLVVGMKPGSGEHMVTNCLHQRCE